MLGWLWRTFVGYFRAPPPCGHKWEVLRSDRVFINGKVFRGHDYVLQCHNCGNLKLFKDYFA